MAVLAPPVAAAAAPSSRDVVANYLLARVASAFTQGHYADADSMSRLHAVLAGMSDQEYLDTV